MKKKKSIKSKLVEGKELTIQQQVFVREYAVHFDAQRAAKEAGYSEKSAGTIGYQLLQNPKVQKAVSKELDDYALEHSNLKKRVLAQLANIAFSDITDYQTWNGDYSTLKDSEQLTKKQRAAIQQVKVTTVTKEDEARHTVELKLCSKEKALELLGRHLGMFTDKIEHKMPTPILIEYPSGEKTYIGAKEE